MNILVVSRCLPQPMRDGDRLILGHLLAEWRVARHRCDVIALEQGEADESARARSRETCDHLEVVAERPRSRWQYAVRLLRPFPRAAAACWHPEMWLAAERRLAAVPVDVVVLFGGVQVYEVRGALRGTPSVIVPYESYSRYLGAGAARTRGPIARAGRAVEQAVARAFERVMFRGHDRVIVLTDADRDALSVLSPSSRLAVIPNGVDWNDTPWVPGSPSIVFVGNLSYAPNVAAARALVTDVLPRVRRRVGNARVVLVGARPSDSVRALAGRDVEIAADVPDVAPWLARAGVFVAPIAFGAGIKNKVLEAMAAGVPVVTTAPGCEGLAVTRGEHLLVEQDAAGLADAAVRVLGDPELAARLGAAARTFVRERHQWADMAARYIALFEDVLREHAARAARDRPATQRG
jgi:glycosyltransferase involved in cell wall biosynthesis